MKWTTLIVALLLLVANELFGQALLPTAPSPSAEKLNHEGGDAAVVHPMKATDWEGAREDIAELRAQLAKLKARNEAQFQRIVVLTDELHSRNDLIRKLQEKQAEYVRQIARMQRIGTSSGPNRDDPLNRLSPMIGGVVLEIRENFMEISLGSDDGLRVGHLLDVMGDEFRGRVIVRRTEPDKAIAEIIPALQKSPIEKGDRFVPYSEPDHERPDARDLESPP